MFGLNIEFPIIVVIILVVFIVCREFLTWYWKIDAILIELKEINKKLGERGP